MYTARVADTDRTLPDLLDELKTVEVMLLNNTRMTTILENRIIVLRDASIEKLITKRLTAHMALPIEVLKYNIAVIGQDPVTECTHELQVREKCTVRYQGYVLCVVTVLECVADHTTDEITDFNEMKTTIYFDADKTEVDATRTPMDTDLKDAVDLFHKKGCGLPLIGEEVYIATRAEKNDRDCDVVYEIDYENTFDDYDNLKK